MTAREAALARLVEAGRVVLWQRLDALVGRLEDLYHADERDENEEDLVAERVGDFLDGLESLIERGFPAEDADALHRAVMIGVLWNLVAELKNVLENGQPKSPEGRLRAA